MELEPPMSKPCATLVALSFLLAACGSAGQPAADPILGSPGPGGLEVTAVPLGPGFATAEVIVQVNGVECGRLTMSRADPRWTEGGLCSRAENRVDLQFVSPTPCTPGGVFLYEGSWVDTMGGVRSYQNLSVAAWDASGEGLEPGALDLDRSPTLLGHAGSGDDEAGTPATSRSWIYQLDFMGRAVSPGCTDRLLLSLETTPASAELAPEIHDFGIEIVSPPESSETSVRVSRQRSGSPLPSVEVQVEGEWKAALSVQSASPDTVSFRIPSPAERSLRLVFGLDALLAMRVGSRMAFEPRDEIPEPYWIAMAQPVYASVRIDDPMEISADATEALRLEEHLAAFFATITSSLSSGHDPASTLEVSVTASHAYLLEPSLPEVRVPLLMVSRAAFVVGEADRIDCEAAPSLACTLAAQLRQALDARDAKDGSIVFDVRFFGTAESRGEAVIELREVRLPLDRVERP